MTREQSRAEIALLDAKNQLSLLTVWNVIDDIYDGFQLKRCETCKYSTVTVNEDFFCEGLLQTFNHDFFCSAWESK